MKHSPHPDPLPNGARENDNDNWNGALVRMQYSNRSIALLACVFLIIGLESCQKSEKPHLFSSENTIHAILFHEISPTNLDGPCASPDYFEDVLKMIRAANLETVKASEIVEFLREGKIPKDNLIAILFDDGWGGNYTYAHPLLKKYGMTATTFVVPTLAGQGQPRRCSWENLREMEESGVWEVQSHGNTHRNFTQLDDAKLMEEMQQSLQTLRDHGFSQEAYIAYPYGGHDERIENAARQAGYAAGFSAGPNGEIKAESDLFKINRTTIFQGFPQELVCRKLGIDLHEVRKRIAIYDEIEGEFSGEWIEDAPAAFVGMYVKSYWRSNKADSIWNINFTIHNEGDYLISLWSPPKRVRANERLGVA